MSNTVQYIININGDANEVLNAISQNATVVSQKMAVVNNRTANFSESMAKVRDAGLAMEGISNMVGRLTSMIDGCTGANQVQQEAEAKLAQVMRNTMGATSDELERIKQLAAAQQQLGVIGDEVQLSGAQELATYLEKTDSLEKLMPVMNDMLAQQYGLNATQEQATQIASMMGKVMEGQTGALSRYGYKFDEAQEKILKYGTEAERVETLAEVISQSVGGMNEALAQTPEGQLKQVSNQMGDIRERIGALWVQLQASLLPVVEKVMGVVNSLVSFIEQHQALFIGIVTTIGMIIAVVKAWTIAQSILNVILSLNPIGIIIMAVAALIGLIVAIIATTEGWGETWNNVWEYVKLSFNQAVTWLKLQWLGTEDCFLTGFEEIEKGWYKLQALWDEDSSAEALARIEQQRNERAEAIAEAEGKIDELAAARDKLVDEGLWQVKWKNGEGDEKEGGGVMAQLQKMTNGDIIPQGGGTGGGTLNGTLGQTAQATATGGTRNTEIHINMGSMVENMIFNGGVGENRADIERQIAEVMSRVLGMAEATAG